MPITIESTSPYINWEEKQQTMFILWIGYIDFEKLTFEMKQIYNNDYQEIKILGKDVISRSFYAKSFDPGSYKYVSNNYPFIEIRMVFPRTGYDSIGNMDLLKCL